MKTFAAALSVLAFSMSLGGAEEQEKFTVGWLRQSCQLLLVSRDNSKSITTEQAIKCIEVRGWLRGFFNGYFAAGFNPSASDSKLYSLPDDLNQFSAAAELIAFIERNRSDLPDTLPAFVPVMCWYMMNHPNASREEKAQGKAMLQTAKESF